MRSYKTLANLQSIKIKLLQDFILESDRLANLYEWRVDTEEMKEIDRLSDELDKITKQINDLMRV